MIRDISGVATCAQLACVLECTCPKPGNVSRYHDFEDTKYEHFLISCITMGSALEEAAQRGFSAGEGSIEIRDVALGELIKRAVEEPRNWHRGGNTNLGTAMLLIPLTVASGFVLANTEIENEAVRNKVETLIRGSTYKDSLYLYEAISIARPGGLGKVEELDVNDESSVARIQEENINLYQLMELSQRDSIARELVTRMETSFEIGYPAIMNSLEEGVCHAVQRAFFEILSRVPDSLIARKNSAEVAEEISAEAKVILENGLNSKKIKEFDEKLRSKGNRLNPGATADLLASSLMVALLNGLKI